MRFSQIGSAALAILISGSMFTACQKEDLTQTLPNTPVKDVAVSDRAADPKVMYGVTVAPNSLLVTMDPGAETVTNFVTVSLNGVAMTDLRGVCCVDDQVYVTTGPGLNNPTIGNSQLLRVNPQTGVAGFISESNVGTVTDIDYNPIDGKIYGLISRSNRLVTISNNFQDYAVANFSLPGALGGRASGLSFVRSSVIDSQPLGLKVTSADGSTTIGTAKLHEIPFTGGVGTFEAVLNPNISLAGANLGIGYNSSIGAPIGRIFVNKNATTDAETGLRQFNYTNPLGPVVNTINTAISGYNFDDLSTSL